MRSDVTRMNIPPSEAYKTLDLTLSTGRIRNDSIAIAQAVNRDGQEVDSVLNRYENLANAAKTYVFTVIVRDGRAVCTIHYPGILQVTGYTALEYSTSPVLWLTMVQEDDKQLVLEQVAQLLRGESPLPIKHRINHKDGSQRWVRNTSVPVRDSQGTLIAYDGLVADISQSEYTEEAQVHQIAELTAALSMVKTLHSLLPVCCSCKNIRDDEGYWQQIESYIEGHYPAISFTHGLCPACARKLYPAYYDEVEKVA